MDCHRHSLTQIERKIDPVWSKIKMQSPKDMSSSWLAYNFSRILNMVKAYRSIGQLTAASQPN